MAMRYQVDRYQQYLIEWSRCLSKIRWSLVDSLGCLRSAIV